MKTLALFTTGLKRYERAELLRREMSDEFPRVSLFNTVLNADIVDERFLERVPGWRKIIYKFIPQYFSQVVETYLQKADYDAVLSWSERRAYLLALLLKVSGSKTKHIALVYWMSKPKQRLFLRYCQSHIHHIITWASVQKDYAINVIGIPASKITFVRYPVDQKFWRPIQHTTTIICSVGSEMRDYATLIKALDGLEIKCHIAAETIRIIQKYKTITKKIEDIGELPPNITIGYKDFSSLRKLYSSSRFVVVPLFPSDTDNGVSTILEAMAMGKAVICSKTKGQVDVLQEGKTGIFVPPGEPEALRLAIQYLWNNPDVANQMGQAGRKYIEEHHTMEQFVDSVKQVVEKITNKKFNTISVNKN